MDSDNENEGFEHSQQQSFDLIELNHSPVHAASEPNKTQNQILLQPPISTYFQSKNCPTPPQLNSVYSYTVKQPNQKSKGETTPSPSIKRSDPAWSCPQQKQLEEEFNESNYRIIYSKFKQDRSNYKYFRQYAKSQYKMFNDHDSIENSDQDREPIKDGKDKPCKLDLLKIQRILSPIPKQLVFRSNFQGGNLEKVYASLQPPIISSTSSLLRKTSSTDQSLTSSFNPQPLSIPKKYFLILSNDTNTIGFNQWFYFKVFNPNFDKQIRGTFIIVNINKKTISNIEDIGIQYFSMDGVRFKGIGWTRVFQGIGVNNKNNIRKDQNHFYHTLQFTCDIKPRDTVYFSLAIPYTLTKLKQFVEKIPDNISVLGYTFCGNPIYLYRTGNSSGKKSILITARQHPSQTSSSYVVEGVINRLEKASLMTNLLKKKYQIYVIPMVNPDGVVHGNSRTNLLGYDVNRKWENDPNKRHSYEVYNLVNCLMKKIPKLQYLIDLHGHSKKLNTFAYFSTKKSIATVISLQMAEKLPWFRVEDCQMATVAPMNTLRWYAGTNLSSEKAITIETSIHGWCDSEKKIQPFTPENLQQIGSTLIDVISRIELQKKSSLKMAKGGIKFAQCHESSDSDPEGDIIKQEIDEPTKTSPSFLQPPQKQLERKSESSSPRRLRIKTCSTNFYKPIQNTTVRQRIKTEYAIEKLNLQLSTPDQKVKRKKTLEIKYYRMKEKNITSIRRLTTGYNQLSQSITFKPAVTQQKDKEKQKLRERHRERQRQKERQKQKQREKQREREMSVQRQRQIREEKVRAISNLGRTFKKSEKSEQRQKIQFCIFDKLIDRKPRNFADLNSRYRDKLLSIRSKLK